MKKTLLSLTDKQHESIKQLAQDKGISKSELLRRIIDEWFDEQVRKEGDR